jgi:phosphopantetheinyl transferase
LSPAPQDDANRTDNRPEVEFLRAWTRLEALAKARGDGIGHLLTTLGITASGVKELTAEEAQARASAMIASSGLQIADIALPDASIGAIAAAAQLLTTTPVSRQLTAADLPFQNF